MERLENKNIEPPMFLQRPSSGRSQDVSHILASAFRDLTRESVGEQTVKNLTISRSGEDRYHEEYVERLANVSFYSDSITVVPEINKKKKKNSRITYR